MIIDVEAELGNVDFSPGSELEEVMQNVRTILTTPKYTVPLDREFGIAADVLDAPIGTAQALLSAEIIAAVARFEPRAKVTKVSYDVNGAADGNLKIIVQVRINGS